MKRLAFGTPTMVDVFAFWHSHQTGQGRRNVEKWSENDPLGIENRSHRRGQGPMRCVATICAILMSSTPALADATAELLRAEHVRKFLRFTFEPTTPAKTDYVLGYAVDSFSPNDLHPVIPGMTIRADHRIDIFLGNHNPLRQSYTVNIKKTPDPNYGAIPKFLDDITTLQRALPQTAAPPAGKFAQAEETACEKFARLVDEANKALAARELPSDTLAGLVNEATGYDGVTKASIAFTSVQTAIKANNATVRDRLKQIDDNFGGKPGEKPKQECKDISSNLLISYNKLTSTADTLIAAKEKLSKSIDDLVKFLQPYLVPTNWRGPVNPTTNLSLLTDYHFTDSIEANFENQNTVSVQANVKDISLDQGVITIKDSNKAKIETTLVVRQSSFFVPERAAAAIYNHLQYPRYGTALNGQGKTVVQRVKDYDPVGGALMLNLIPQIGISAVYPMIQFGVSSAKDFPGFLAGVGFRFAAPAAFSISAGGMITRYRDLDNNLHVNQEVTGTADIESHLQQRWSPVVLYGALQVKF